MTATHPHQRKLGRTPRSHDPRIPHLSALLAGKAVAPPPASADYTSKMPASFGMMMNDTLGDCTCAAFYHALQVWSFNALGQEVTEPDVDVEQLYVKACGYNPHKGGEGPGGNEQTVLQYILSAGAPFGPKGQAVHKILGFVEVDPRNINDVKSTINDCGVAYIGFNVPQNIMPADAEPPAVWTVAPTKQKIIGGHAVVLTGYDASTATIISWGQLYKMTWDFFTTYVDEVYAIADSDWVAKTGKTPAGMTLTELEAQMQALKGAAAATA